MRFQGKYPSTRLRRGRNEDWVRRLISENNLSVDDLIMPIFICEGKNKIEKIHSMPGVYRYSIDKLGSVIKRIEKLKIPLVALFPYISSNKKDNPHRPFCSERCKLIDFRSWATEENVISRPVKSEDFYED